MASRGPRELPATIVGHSVNLLEPAHARALVERVRPTHLLHLAWVTAPGLYSGSSDNPRWAEASAGLVEAFLNAGGRRVVATGSCAEYAWGAQPLREGVAPVRPATPYGLAKETLRAAIASRTEALGRSAAWARIFFLYGPGEHPDRFVASVIRALLRGARASCANGAQIRDYLHVADAGEALAAITASDLTGAINVGSGSGVRMRDLVARIVARLGPLGRQELIDWGTAAAPSPNDVVVADVRRLREELGWSPRIGLDQGIDDAIAWWKGHSPHDADDAHNAHAAHDSQDSQDFHDSHDS